MKQNYIITDQDFVDLLHQLSGNERQAVVKYVEERIMLFHNKVAPAELFRDTNRPSKAKALPNGSDKGISRPGIVLLFPKKGDHREENPKHVL